ncbi:hypothetical protein [Herpetosiphon sp. NSE202]|uniref:hypothetical protein n=1 Tax=Herpetosiphon sp. NSE202 TaxID=3351349 RepID=UPI003629F7FA
MQYFDKGRMEINNPDANEHDLWYVTSGLLPIDLMHAETSWDHNGWHDAFIAVIGDPGSFPTYRDLQVLYQNPATESSATINTPAHDLLRPDLSIGVVNSFHDDPATLLRQGSNGHFVPQAMLDFMQQTGKTLRDGQVTTGMIYDPVYIFGHPVTPAVWVETTVAGKPQTVLFQVFERRVLTYNPANPPAFQVEMGNVGAHYYDWLTNPQAAREYDYVMDQSQFTSADGTTRYRLELKITTITDPNNQLVQDGATYWIYQSTDGGKTETLQFTGQLGPHCRSTLFVSLLRPRASNAAPQHVGLMTGCALNPSSARGFGITVATSYTGGKTWQRRGGN